MFNVLNGKKFVSVEDAARIIVQEGILKDAKTARAHAQNYIDKLDNKTPKFWTPPEPVKKGFLQKLAGKYDPEQELNAKIKVKLEEEVDNALNPKNDQKIDDQKIADAKEKLKSFNEYIEKRNETI